MLEHPEPIAGYATAVATVLQSRLYFLRFQVILTIRGIRFSNGVALRLDTISFLGFRSIDACIEAIQGWSKSHSTSLQCKSSHESLTFPISLLFYLLSILCLT